MPAKSLEAEVRHQPRVAIVELQGEIDSFAEDVLNAAYAEAESRRTCHPTQLQQSGLYQ